jgi:uncharacterized protein (DUF2252 family)
MVPASSIVDRIQNFNQGRNPEILQLKYQRLREDPFRFLRGTCHLFYEDWPADSPLNQAPLAWVCGDLHLENFGSYKGNDRVVYFDINDFDEAALAPCTWDVARLLTAIWVAAVPLKLSPDDARSLCQTFLNTYTSTLRQGQLGVIDKSLAKGQVADLLDTLQKRDRQDFLDTRTEMDGKRRKLRLDGEKILAIPKAQRTQIKDLIEAWGAQQENPSFYSVLDVGRRIAGTGSLGCDRYIILVEGKGSPDKNYLLDLKAATPSALNPYLSPPQPQWKTAADRIVTIQARVQWAPPARLAAIALHGQSYVLRELQPTQDRVNLNDTGSKAKRMARVLDMMGKVTAWSQLRSSGRQNAAIADDLINFGQATLWHTPLLTYAEAYAQQVQQDYHDFCQATTATH